MKYNTTGTATIMKTYKYGSTILCLIILGCAAQQPIVQEEKSADTRIPPGIDTLTAVIADSLFSLVLVSEEDENDSRQLFEQAEQWNDLADSLWQASRTGLNNREDSLIALKQVALIEAIFQSEQEWLKQTQKMMKKLGRLNSAVLARMSDALFVKATNLYESAIKKNRFEIRYRRRYSQFLKSLATRYNAPAYLQHAASELERIVFFIKGNHQLFSDLGEIYLLLADWKNAYKQYDLAQVALRRTAIFMVPEPKLYLSRPSEVPIDTLRLMSYLDKAGWCKTKLYEALPALSIYREAFALATEPAWQQLFEKRIKWILWDDGNIRATEIRDKGDSLFQFQQKYAEAKTVYLALLPSLWTKRTRDEINWKIAQLDFAYLDHKFDGVGRMHQIIRHTAMDSITGAPLDSTYQRYFNSYGAMCFNIGAENWNKDRLTAFLYLNQAVEINFDLRSKAFLLLADFSEFDPHETIELCTKTLEVIENLTVDERQILYQLLHSSYRKLGDFQQAKAWFDRWKAL